MCHAGCAQRAVDSARRVSAGEHEMELVAFANGPLGAGNDGLMGRTLQRLLIANRMPAAGF